MQYRIDPKSSNRISALGLGCMRIPGFAIGKPDPRTTRDIIERDERDMTRETAPLRQADDAVLIDSSDMTIPEVTAAIAELCK